MMATSGGGSNAYSLRVAESVVTAYVPGLRGRKKVPVSARATDPAED